MNLKRHLVPFSLAILIMIYPLRGGDTLGLGFLPSALALALVGLAFALRPRGRFELGGADIVVGTYLLLLLVSVLVSGATDISLRYVTQIAALSFFPYFLIRGAGFSIDDATNFLKVFPYVNIVAALSMVAIVGTDQILTYSGYRLGSQSLNPVGIGYAFGLSTLITVAALKRRVCGLIIGSLSVAISVSVLVLTGSRGAMLALVFALVILLLGRGEMNWRMVLALCVVSISGYLVFGTLSQVMVYDRFSNVLDSASAHARFSSWTQAHAMFSERPFLGFGLGAYEAKHGEYVHNVVLEHLANGGIVLTIPFIILVVGLTVMVAVGVVHKRNEVVVIIALLGVYAVIVRMFSLSMANSKEVFLFLAMALSCSQSLPRSPISKLAIGTRS